MAFKDPDKLKAWLTANRDRLLLEKRQWGEAHKALLRARNKARRDARANEGICVRCGKQPATMGRMVCQPCALTQCEKAKAQYRKTHEDVGVSTLGKHKTGVGKQSITYRKRKAYGLCVRCSMELPDNHKTVTCNICKEKEREEARRFREAHPDHWIWRKYGITMSEWKNMFRRQGECCAICGSTVPYGKGWSTDHDHATGKVRGILCHHCNTGLGHFKDSRASLLCAVKYLSAAPTLTSQGGHHESRQ